MRADKSARGPGGFYEKALALKPDLAEVWFGRGNVFYDLERHGDAYAAYDRALALDAGLAEAWFGRGTALKSAGLGAATVERKTVNYHCLWATIFEAPPASQGQHRHASDYGMGSLVKHVLVSVRAEFQLSYGYARITSVLVRTRLEPVSCPLGLSSAA